MKKRKTLDFLNQVLEMKIHSIKKVFKKSWLGYGSNVREFENKFSKFIGTKYAVGLNSCTAALHLALAVNKFKKESLDTCNDI